MIRLALIDDHALIAESVARYLKEIPGIAEIRVFVSGDVFLEQKQDWEPDIILTDMSMPGTNGIPFIQKLRKTGNKTLKIIVVSMLNDINTVKMALKNGADCYISKGSGIAELERAIDDVMMGKTHVSKDLTDKLIKNMLGEEKISVTLTPREKEVLGHICRGLSMKEIAYEMQLSANTISSFTKNIMKKFDVHKAVDLVVAAMQMGLYIPG